MARWLRAWLGVVFATLAPSFATAQPAPDPVTLDKSEIAKIFSLRHPQWDDYAKQTYLSTCTPVPGANEICVDAKGRFVQLSAHSTGTQVGLITVDQGNEEIRFSETIQPFYKNDDSPPGLVVIEIYYPAGRYLFTEMEKRKIETRARNEIGPSYTLEFGFKANFRYKITKTPYDIVSFGITKRPH
jgi:hypothetical protein